MSGTDYSDEDGSYSITTPFKEAVVYWEGPNGFLFDGGWGVTPPVVYVPPEDLWASVVPRWLAGRRDIVVRRLGASGGVVKDGYVDWYRAGDQARVHSR